MHAISSYRGNRPTHTQTHPPTNRQGRLYTIHCTAASAQCKNSVFRVTCFIYVLCFFFVRVYSTGFCTSRAWYYINLLKRLLCVNRKLIFSVTAPLVGIETLYYYVFYFILLFYFIVFSVYDFIIKKLVRLRSPYYMRPCHVNKTKDTARPQG